MHMKCRDKSYVVGKQGKQEQRAGSYSDNVNKCLCLPKDLQRPNDNRYNLVIICFVQSAHKCFFISIEGQAYKISTDPGLLDWYLLLFLYQSKYSKERSLSLVS